MLMFAGLLGLVSLGLVLDFSVSEPEPEPTETGHDTGAVEMVTSRDAPTATKMADIFGPDAPSVDDIVLRAVMTGPARGVCGRA